MEIVEIDLLFLDLEMRRLNGFKFLDPLGDIQFEAVFTTAYSRYAIKAFQYEAFHYLLKPIDEDELQQVLQKFSTEEKIPELHEQEISAHIEQLKKDNLISVCK